jgi:hypothetical protein
MSNTTSRFWLLTFPLGPDFRRCHLLDALGDEDDSSGPSAAAIAIEVFRAGNSCAILVSLANSRDQPTELRGVFGAANDPAWCNAVATLGLPVVDAAISFTETGLVTNVPVYGVSSNGGPSSLRPEKVMELEGLDWDVSGEGSALSSFGPHYYQRLESPDIAQPDTKSRRRVSIRIPPRAEIQKADITRATTTINTEILYPDLAHLFPASPVQAISGWHGTAAQWDNVNLAAWRRADYGGPRVFPRPVTRRSVFGTPSFLFDDLEMVAFRAPVGRRAALSNLIEPLNFHLADRHAFPAFEYLPATGVAAIQLLRYGRMRSRNPPPPFTPQDFMSQHELLVGLTVGKVDDDAAQARDASMFVPAIFVDNPWSKVLGRCLLGFPKVLASFCTNGQPLTMDGRDADDHRVPLSHVTDIHLVDRVDAFPTPLPGAGGGPAGELLAIRGLRSPDGSEDTFIDLSAISSFFDVTSTRRSPLSLSDFEGSVFQGTFATDLLTNGFNVFRSVQVSPVDDLGLPRAWINGTCQLNKIKIAFPLRTATLTFNAPPAASPGWQQVCDALGGSGVEVTFVPGDWYRLKCSMDLVVDDGLA